MLTRCLALILASSLAAASFQGGERSLLITVLDDDGAAIRDLTAEDFTVSEETTARTVTSAALSTEPLYVVVVVDTTQPPGQNRQVLDLREALKVFVDVVRAGNPDGRTALIQSAGTALRTTAFDATPAELDREIQRLVPAYQVESSILEAVGNAGRMLGEARSLRRAIVSVDLDSVDPQDVGIEQIAAAVEQAGAAFWSVSVRTSGLASPQRETLFNYLPYRTGGLRQNLVLSRPLTQILRRLARTLNSQYVVTFRRPADAPVTTVHPGVSRGAQVLMAPWMR